MGKEVPKANDKVFGIEAAERNTYWCNLAMVRADHQGKGIAKAMFELAYEEVTLDRFCFDITSLNVPLALLSGCEDWCNGGPDDDQYP